MSEVKLDWNALIDADTAFLAAQQRGVTTAECVRAAIIAYLAFSSSTTTEAPDK